jgi:hypothetical protein
MQPTVGRSPTWHLNDSILSLQFIFAPTRRWPMLSSEVAILMRQKTVILISCGKRKLKSSAVTREMYVGSLFRKSLKYAEVRYPGAAIYVLSAKHGLLALQDRITPYDLTLNQFTANELKRWAERTMVQLRQATDLRSDRFIFLAGVKYRKFLAEKLKSPEIPMRGLPIGKQLKFLNAAVDE